MQVSGRLNVLTQGQAGKGNAVLNIGPGSLSMENSAMPLHLSGEAKQNDLILYARLPAKLTGSLYDPQLTFEPGALLRSRGRIIDSLDIDEIRWPLAGVKLTQKGVDGRLQAILRAHENEMGNFELHLDGQANDFLPDNGLWQWRFPHPKNFLASTSAVFRKRYRWKRYAMRRGCAPASIPRKRYEPQSAQNHAGADAVKQKKEWQAHPGGRTH